MNFTGAIKTCLKKYFSFKGRASRSEYWYFKLFIGSLWLLLCLADYSLNNNGLTIVFDLILILTFFPSWTVEVRRLHDVNRSGWWLLLYLTLVGGLIILYWCVKRSDDGDNEYGSNPYSELTK